MSLEHRALAETHNLPIKHEGPVHSGKVRSVYWLPQDESDRIISEKGFPMRIGEQLGVMVTSDRISAFDVNWKGEDGLEGIPGKGAALNTISKHWFDLLYNRGVADHHHMNSPHPLVWLVQRAEPIKVEAIARRYITGSMWRAYDKGAREFCGVSLPEGLVENQRLPGLLITPTTKGIMRGIPGVPETDDANLTREQLVENYEAFGFKSPDDVVAYEGLLYNAFTQIETELAAAGQLLVDTKLEFGYAQRMGEREMVIMDEVGTPDSSRMWDSRADSRGKIVENSKERFRRHLMDTHGKEVFTDATRMPERKMLAQTYRVPVNVMMDTARIYTDMAEKITGKRIPDFTNPRESILAALSKLGLVT